MCCGTHLKHKRTWITFLTLTFALHVFPSLFDGRMRRRRRRRAISSLEFNAPGCQKHFKVKNASAIVRTLGGIFFRAAFVGVRLSRACAIFFFRCASLPKVQFRSTYSSRKPFKSSHHPHVPNCVQ